MSAAVLAFAVANSPTRDTYRQLLHSQIGPLTVHHWVTDAFMALFFLLVGLEVKREWYEGQLASSEARRLPIIAAIGGMAAPALVYLLATGFSPMLMRGWAIPAATDIAFALGVLALLGARAPASLKLLLVTIAIVDDIGAVAIIAAFYTSSLSIPAAVAGALITFGNDGDEPRRCSPSVALPDLLPVALGRNLSVRHPRHHLRRRGGTDDTFA